MKRHSDISSPELIAQKIRYRYMSLAVVMAVVVSIGGYFGLKASLASTTLVYITGNVSVNGRGQPSVQIYNCRTGTQQVQVPTDANGNFKFYAGGDGGNGVTEKGYCVEVKSGLPAGATGGPTNLTPEAKNAGGNYGYQWQLANTNCYHAAFCAGTPYYSYDRNTDAGMNFAFKTPPPPPPDTTPPSVSIQAPSNGQTVGGTVTVNAAASDASGINRTVLIIDGQARATDSSTPYSYSWNTAGYAPGNHTIGVEAIDNSANQNHATATITVKVSGGGGGTPTPPSPTPSSGRPANRTGVKTNVPATTPNGQPDITPPSVPGNFQAQVNNNAVALSWQASTDDVGVAGYRLERSLDQTTWSVLGENITDTSYTDNTAGFGTTYYYRLTAFDGAGNGSDYATTQVTTGSFSSNTSGNTTINSDDNIVTVTIPDGALSDQADCSVSSDTDNASSLPLKGVALVAGPYSVICKDASGNLISNFQKPITVSVALTKDQTKHYKGFTFYSYGDGKWTKFKVTNNKKAKAYQFSTTTAPQFAVIGKLKKGLSAQTIILIIMFLGLIGGVIYFLYRRAQQQNYQEYIRKKYYNL